MQVRGASQVLPEVRYCSERRQRSAAAHLRYASAATLSVVFNLCGGERGRKDRRSLRCRRSLSAQYSDVNQANVCSPMSPELSPATSSRAKLTRQSRGVGLNAASDFLGWRCSYVEDNLDCDLLCCAICHWSRI
jgi:hypothetical protein